MNNQVGRLKKKEENRTRRKTSGHIFLAEMRERDQMKNAKGIGREKRWQRRRRRAEGTRQEEMGAKAEEREKRKQQTRLPKMTEGRGR